MKIVQSELILPNYTQNPPEYWSGQDIIDYISPEVSDSPDIKGYIDYCLNLLSAGPFDPKDALKDAVAFQLYWRHTIHAMWTLDEEASKNYGASMWAFYKATQFTQNEKERIQTLKSRFKKANRFLEDFEISLVKLEIDIKLKQDWLISRAEELMSNAPAYLKGTRRNRVVRPELLF